jgi:type II secretory pathway component PulM
MSALASRINTWYETLQPREQLIVRVGAVVACVLLVAGSVLRMHALVSGAEKRLAGKRADIAYIGSVMSEVRSAPMPAGSGQSLVSVIDRTTRDGGLGMNLRGTEPSGMNGVRVHFEGASFDALATWLLRVQREYGLTVQAATLERTDAAGRVNANLTFVRS